jgi:predicted Zn-dependent protease
MNKAKRQAEKIVEQALAHAGKRVDGIEVMVTGNDYATSRFAVNSMTQNQSPVTESVSIRVLTKGRQARLSSDQLSEEGLKRLVDHTIAAAKLLEKEDELLPLPKAKEAKASQQIDRVDKKTAQFSPQDRADEIKKMIQVGKDFGLEAAGTFSSGSASTYIGNSRGLNVYHKETFAESSITMTAPDSSGWAKADGISIKSFDATELARRAAQKALAGASPAQIEPGRMTVILEPSAVLDLVCFLWYDFAATAHLDKLSSLLNKLGNKVFGENITITDDYTHPLSSGLPFDGEGVAKTVVKLVENGVFSNMVFGRQSAAKMQARPTGHGLMQPNAYGEWPANIVIAGGSETLEEMVEKTEHGVYVTRVWYVREVDPHTKLLTGMTQDGTFLIKDGAIASGIKNMRFNVSLHELLNNVIALSPIGRAAGEEGSSAVVPAMKVADFNFTERSLF